MTAPLRRCDTCGMPIPTGDLFCPGCAASAPTESGFQEPVAPRSSAEALSARLAEVQLALGGGFEVRRQVGQGGFGEVWAAYDTQLHRMVAVKVLRPELVATLAFRERFRREARAVARLRHPNIVPIYFVGAAHGLEYFIMPLVEGVTLKAALEQQGRLSLAESIRILSEAAGALREAHARGIVHRDLKPENFMLEGPERRVLLMDFGIAQSPDELDRELTGPGLVLGSPEFMSPEQATGAKQLDSRSDIYSLGVVAYRMLAGRLPFDAATARELLVHHIATPPEPIERLAEVPPALAEAVMRCLVKDPGGRWQSSDAFLRALTGTPDPSRANDTTAPATPAVPPLGSRPSRRPRRRPALVAVLVALLLVAAALGAVTVRQLTARTRAVRGWAEAAAGMAERYRLTGLALDSLARRFAAGDSTGAQALAAQEDRLLQADLQLDDRYGAALDAFGQWPDSLQRRVQAARERMLRAGLVGTRYALRRSEVEGCRLRATADSLAAEDEAAGDNCWWQAAGAPALAAPVEYFVEFRVAAPLRRDAGVGVAWCVRAADCRVLFVWPDNAVVWGTHRPRSGLRPVQSGARTALPVGRHRLRVRLQDGLLRVRLDERLVLERPASQESEFLERPASLHLIVQNAALTFAGTEPLGVVAAGRSP